MAGVVVDPRARTPRAPENFRKYSKNSSENRSELNILAYFTKIERAWVNYLLVWTTNTKLWKN